MCRVPRFLADAGGDVARVPIAVEIQVVVPFDLRDELVQPGENLADHFPLGFPFPLRIAALQDFEDAGQVLLDVRLSLRGGEELVFLQLVDELLELIADAPLTTLGEGLPQDGGLLRLGYGDDLGQAVDRLLQFVELRLELPLLGLEIDRHGSGRGGGRFGRGFVRRLFGRSGQRAGREDAQRFPAIRRRMI